MKNRPVEAALFHADRQRNSGIDRQKLIVAFRNFANAPKNFNWPQGVGCGPISVDAWVHSQSNRCFIGGGQMGSRTDFF